MPESSLLCPTCARPVAAPPEHHGLWGRRPGQVHCQYCNRPAPLAEAQKMAEAFVVRCRQFRMQIEGVAAALPALSNAEAVRVLRAHHLEEQIHYVRNLDELGRYACERFRRVLRDCILGSEQPQLTVERLTYEGAEKALKIYGRCVRPHPPTEMEVEAWNLLAACLDPPGYLIHVSAGGPVPATPPPGRTS